MALQFRTKNWIKAKSFSLEFKANIYLVLTVLCVNTDFFDPNGPMI